MRPGRRTILIVDDDPLVLTTYRYVFENAGWAVHSTTNGESVRTVVAERRVDAILLDIFMPDTDGIEILRELRRTLADTPIVMMTGGGRLGNHSLLQATLKLGADAVYSKSSPARMLVRLVESCCTARRISAASS